MSRYSRHVSKQDVAAAVLILIGASIISLSVSVAVDAALAQAALWVAGSWGVICGFWHMFWTVWVLTLIVGVSAGVAIRTAK